MQVLKEINHIYAINAKPFTKKQVYQAWVLQIIVTVYSLK